MSFLFYIQFQWKIKDFQGPKTSFKYFQGLEIGLLKFKGFQDAYEPSEKITFQENRTLHSWS